MLLKKNAHLKFLKKEHDNQLIYNIPTYTIFYHLICMYVALFHLGVSKKNRGTGKPGNRKPGSRFEKTKNRVPRFRYPVFTGLPGTLLNIYFFLFFF
jgi:hypothetical protein